MGSQSADRTLEERLQLHQTAQFAGLPHPQTIFAAVYLFQSDYVRLPEKRCCSPKALITTGTELGGLSTGVIRGGTSVAWDELNSLWYSDIRIVGAETRTPFVKFAVARYQPHSVEEAELSEVVDVEFNQVMSDRKSSFSRVTFSDGLTGINISVAGPTLGGLSLNAKESWQTWTAIGAPVELH